MPEEVMFPYEYAIDTLINIFKDHLPNEKKFLRDKLNTILDLHLQEDNLVMPNMTPAEKENTLELIINNSNVDSIKQSLKFENSNTKEGMFRVLIRTHLNRSGINHVSMGHWEKTLSPRILDFTDTIDVKNVYKEIYSDIVYKWLEFANKNNNPINENIYYDDRAIEAISKIANHITRKNIDPITMIEQYSSAVGISHELNADLGWCRIVFGVITGLKYLEDNKWNLYEQAHHEDLAYEDIHSLITECKTHICEYGYALSGSYLADLGSPYFVKDDTHVRACVEAISGNNSTPKERVRFVINSANAIGIKPRILDKIMYIACSGKLYLCGLNMDNPRIIKQNFISELSKKTTITRN